MLDLYHAERDELIRLILAQREALAEQAALLARQQQELVAQQGAECRIDATGRRVSGGESPA
jgi:hypothetical protein